MISTSRPPAGSPVVVFLGPTLPVEEAQEILPARYVPPAEVGSVYRVALDRPPAIGIVDGYFERLPSVWHKEILWAMASGIHVYGGASMGALRAAELESFGMHGVGRIFEAYRDGALEDDDEVAVMHQPAEGGYRPASTAMVDIRSSFREAERAGAISVRRAEELLQVAKQLSYPDRTYEQIIEAAQGCGAPPAELCRLRAWLDHHAFSQKRQDALDLLRRISDDLDSGLPPFRPPFTFASTATWQLLVETEGPPPTVPPTVRRLGRGDRSGRRLARQVSPCVRPGAEERPSGDLVSVIIPTHNRCSLLQQAVDSVRSQSTGGWELVIVDDASQDPTPQWLAQLQEPRIRVLRLPSNEGAPSARNAGLSVCGGRFVLFLDDDDLLTPGALATLQRALREHPTAVAATGGEHGFDEDCEWLNCIPPRRTLVREVWPDVLAGLWITGTGRTMFRTEVLRGVGGWDESIFLGEDDDLWLRLAGAGPVVIIPETVMKWRLHGGPRTPSPEAIEEEGRFRRRFVERLPSESRNLGLRLLQSWRSADEAGEAFAARSFGTALRCYTRALRSSPGLLASPLTRPVLLPMLRMSLIGAAFEGPSRLVRRASRRYR